MTLPGATPPITESQYAALRMVGKAYEADRAVKVGSRTRWSVADSPQQDHAVISQRMMVKLVDRGIMRFSEPTGRYALITPTGHALLGLNPADDPTGP